MNRFLVLSAVNGFLAVSFGAFGAHGLEHLLSAAQMQTWQTGVQYHMFHTLALFGTGLWLKTEIDNAWLVRGAWLFLAGIVLFSGSLYVLAVTGISALGMITPFGGLAFLAGWTCLALAVRPRLHD